MAILVGVNTKYIIQGLTGKEGQRAASFMKAMGVEIIGGVRPGKGGEVVDGVKIFNGVKEFWLAGRGDRSRPVRAPAV